MTKFHVVIPARYGSERLTGKPLIDLGGRTMIQRVVEQAMQSTAESVVVATDDERVSASVASLEVRTVLTSGEHQSGTDRIREVASQLGWDEQTILVNVQGDEPLIPPLVIDQVASLLYKDSNCEVGTLCEPITESQDIFDPNVVKVVSNSEGRALYFSRAPIPWNREHFPNSELVQHSKWKRHVGIYAYRVSAISRFVELPASWLERTESLEQLRFLDYGYSIAVEEACETIPPGVDTSLDAERIRELLQTK